MARLRTMQLGRVFDGQIEDDATPDRTTHDHRFVKLQCAAKSPDDLGVACRREEVLFLLPSLGRIGLAVPGHIEGQHAKVPGDLRVVQEMTPLPRVRAGCVQTNQGDALSRLLEIDAIRPAIDLGPNVTTDNRFEFSGHGQLSVKMRRGAARRFLMY
jgi:hypothetical protein